MDIEGYKRKLEEYAKTYKEIKGELLPDASPQVLSRVLVNLINLYPSVLYLFNSIHIQRRLAVANSFLKWKESGDKLTDKTCELRALRETSDLYTLEYEYEALVRAIQETINCVKLLLRGTEIEREISEKLES